MLSGQEMSLINHFKWQVLTNEQLVIPMLIKSVIPNVSGPEMSPIKRQVTSSNQWTTCIYPFAYIKCQVTSSNQRTTCIYLLPNVMWQVPTNEQLVFTFLLYAKRRVLTNEQLTFTFIICQAASSNQWAADIYLYHRQVESSNKRTTCNSHFPQKCHHQCVWSRDVTNQSFQVASSTNEQLVILILSSKVSSPICLVKRYHPSVSSDES